MADQVKVTELVEALNDSHAGKFEIVSKMPVGTHGAWTVRNLLTGKSHVLKLVSSDDTTEHIWLTGECAGLVKNGYRTAGYDMIGFFEGIGSFYLQELLPGSPASRPTKRLVSQMIRLNRRQSGKGLAQGINHTEKVHNILFEDGRGFDGRDWLNRVAAFSQAGASLVADVRSLIAPHADFRGETRDIVHGDYQHYNALVDEHGFLVGYVDWDNAGYGDRGIDLARLLYDVYVAETEKDYPPHPQTLSALCNEILTASGYPGLQIYGAFWVMQVAEWGIRSFPQDEHVNAKFIGTGRRILSDLRAAS